MRNEVLVNWEALVVTISNEVDGLYDMRLTLNHGPPRSLFVFQPSLTTDTDNLRIIGTSGDESIEGVGSDGSISIDDEHELQSRCEGSASVHKVVKRRDIPRKVEDQLR